MHDGLISALIDAFALPPEARVDRRISKATLIERAPRSADRKIIESQIARLDWVAEMSPGTVRIPALADPPAPAINVLVLTPAKPATMRLKDMIHWLIPAPIVLLTRLAGGLDGESDGGIELSLARKRTAQRVEGVVSEGLTLAPPLPDPPDAVAAAFIASLALGGLPQTNLWALYEALCVRVEALDAARAANAAFRLPANSGEAVERRAALGYWHLADVQWSIARGAAKKEKRLAQAVALGEKARKLKALRDAAAAALA